MFSKEDSIISCIKYTYRKHNKFIFYLYTDRRNNVLKASRQKKRKEPWKKLSKVL